MAHVSFFFFKQKTAYEMRISDWSSDVCSSDLFHNARPVHMPADLKELCSLFMCPPKTGKPRRPTPENGGRNSDRFNIVDGGWTTIKTGACGKWRLQSRLPLLPLKAFDHRGLFAADISACATMNEYIEVIARARRVLADQLGFVSLPDCGFQDRKRGV